MPAYVNVGSTGTIREEKLSYNGGKITLPQIKSECNLIEQSIVEVKNVLGEAWSYEKESKYMKELGAQR